MRIANLKIGARLGMGFGVLVLLVVMTGAIGANRMASINAAMENLLSTTFVRLDMASEWSAGIRVNGVRTIALLDTGDTQMAESLRADMGKQSGRVNEIQEKLESMIADDKDRALFNEVARLRKEYIDIRTQAYAMKQSGDGQLPQWVASKMLPAMHAYQTSVDNVFAHYREGAQQAQVTVASDYSTGRSMLFGGIVISVLLGGFIAWRLTGGITRPLDEALRMAEAVSAGNLTTRPRIVPGQDEPGQLLQALERMQVNLTDVVSQIRQGAAAINTGSGEIARGNLDLSSRTEEQASALEQTAASMEELTENVRKNAENADMATQLSAETTSVARKGGEVVSRVEERMVHISESSQKIASITGVIDGIAFQTNILALNAAVEAARAGEQGRGFAVVASEVRTLAQRSANAAKEIQDLIGDSVRAVQAGSEFVNQAGQTIREIMKSAEHLHNVMDEISAAGQEQSAQIVQVNQAIVQMDQVTQQNAALVEEAAAASASLQEQASSLVTSVSVFAVPEMHGRLAGLPRAPSRHAQEMPQLEIA